MSSVGEHLEIPTRSQIPNANSGKFRPIRKSGLFANLYAATTREAAATSYMMEFLSIMKRVSFNTPSGVEALPG